MQHDAGRMGLFGVHLSYSCCHFSLVYAHHDRSEPCTTKSGTPYSGSRMRGEQQCQELYIGSAARNTNTYMHATNAELDLQMLVRMTASPNRRVAGVWNGGLYVRTRRCVEGVR